MPHEIIKIPAKVTPEQVTPGDFLLISGRDWTDKLIQFGQALRLNKNDKKFAKWNHAALITHTDGTIVEALGKGIVQSNISKYWEWEYVIVHLDVSNEDRLEIVNFANSCLGEKYGWFTVFSIALSLLTGSMFAFNLDGEECCSGLVARAIERGNYIPDRDASHICPALLAKTYNAL